MSETVHKLNYLDTNINTQTWTTTQTQTDRGRGRERERERKTTIRNKHTPTTFLTLFTGLVSIFASVLLFWLVG